MVNKIITPCYCPVCKCSKFSISCSLYTCINCHYTFTKQQLLNANMANVTANVKEQVNSFLTKEVKKMNLRLKKRLK